MAASTRYEKLRNLLREKITSGKYQRGDRFFSQNELMEKYNLSFSTVTRALDELVREGYLLREKGKGTFIGSTQAPIKEHAKQANVFLFAPWDAKSNLLVNPANLYQHLEALRSQDFLLKFVPHSSGPDDLEPYLFSRDPMDIAVFFYPPSAQHAFIQKLAESVPTVVLTNSPMPLNGQVIVTCAATAAEMAIRHLLMLGHLEIAVVGLENNTQCVSFIDGYRTALKASGLAYNETLVARPDPTLPRVAPGLSSVADRSTDKEITAVFALGNMAALEAISELHSMGKAVPGDVSIICFDDLQKAATLPDPLSAVIFPVRQIAIHLTSAIQMALEKPVPCVVPIMPQLNIASSTAPRRTSATLGNKTP